VNARVGVGVSTVDVVDMYGLFGQAMTGSPMAGGLTVRPAPLPSLLAGREEVAYARLRRLPRWTRMLLVGGRGRGCRETVWTRCRHPLSVSGRDVATEVDYGWLLLHLDGGGGGESRIIALEGNNAASFVSELREVQ
jgi:hypothetical protein